MGILPEMKTIRDLSGFEKQLNRGYRRDMVALFILLALAGLVVLGFSHRYGPWVDATGVENIVAARNLAWGNGLTIPAAEGYSIPYAVRPPLYSLVLSLGVLAGGEPFWVVSILNVVLFAGTLFLLSWGLWRITDSVLLAFGIALLFSFTPQLISNFDGASSTGLVIFLVTANLVCLIQYFQEENRAPYVLALVTAMLAFLTGFIGGACILAGAAAMLIFSEKTFWRKLVYASVYAFGAALPLILWQVYQVLQTRTAALRATGIIVSFREAFKLYLQQLVQVGVQWLPGQPQWVQTWLQTKGAFFALVIAALILYGLMVWRYVEKKDRSHRRWFILLTTCLLFAVSAAAMVFAESYLQSRTAPVLSISMFAPVYPFLIIFFFGCMLALIASVNAPLYSLLLPGLIGAFFVIANMQPTLQYIYARYQYGSTYTTPQWRSSEVLKIVNQTSALRTYFSTDPQGLLLHSHYAPYDISRYDYSVPFLAQNAYLADVFQEEAGSLILFQPAYLNPEDPLAEQMDYSLFTQGLQLVYQGPDGEIYVPLAAVESEN